MAVLVVEPGYDFAEQPWEAAAGVCAAAELAGAFETAEAVVVAPLEGWRCHSVAQHPQPLRYRLSQGETPIASLQTGLTSWAYSLLESSWLQQSMQTARRQSCRSLESSLAPTCSRMQESVWMPAECCPAMLEQE